MSTPASVSKRELRVRLASQAGRRALVVAPQLVELYGPRLGPGALAAYLVLRLAADEGPLPGDLLPAELVARQLGMEVLEAAEALHRLTLYGLLEQDRDGTLWLYEPLSREEFLQRFGPSGDGDGSGDGLADGGDAGGAEAAAGAGVLQQVGLAAQQVAAAAPARPHGPGTTPIPAGASGDGGAEGLPQDVRGVLEWYHQRIGLISESQFERLCEWITRRGMTADVVALAIEETARSAQYASFSYLEGVLRNWYNQGVRTWQDLSRRRHLSSVLARAPEGPAGPGGGQGHAAAAAAGGQRPAEEPSMEGVPNAEAYRPVDPEQVRRWKEMYARGR